MTNTVKKSKTRIFTKAMAAIVAATVLGTSFSAPANAGRNERLVIGGVIAGIIGTAIVASEVRRNRERRVYRQETRWERHVRRCYAAYRSYDERYDTYISYGGQERRCRK